MKAAVLYLAAIYFAVTHADVVGQTTARVMDFVTAHVPPLH
ncbi:MAG TPA: hypothetical protein VKT72_08640 [Candidatus Baltobacteraceae bacterium]|nr:hypothetical protein [Candidatus Baltobacteraceae bacterium]